MIGKDRQRGASAFQFLCYTLAGVFGMLVLFKIMPVYMDNMSVKTVLNSLDDKSSIRQASPKEIRGWIGKGFQVNALRDIPTSAITVRQEGAFLVADVNYERRVDLISNIDVVLTFENSWKIKQQ